MSDNQDQNENMPAIVAQDTTYEIPITREEPEVLPNTQNTLNTPRPLPEPAVSGGQFCVRTITGSGLYFSYDENKTIGQLKQDLFEVQNIPVSEQRLIFNAKQLEDNLTLKDYGIGPDSTVHLVLRVRGGY